MKRIGGTKMRLEKGDVVVYGVRGVCTVTDIKIESIAGSDREYYLLTPRDDARSVIYLPTDSDRIDRYVKKMITKDEIIRLIDTLPEREDQWIPDNRRRAEIFGKIIDGGDRADIIRLIRVLSTRKHALEGTGKKLGAADKNILEQAEKVVYDELALVLGIDHDEVEAFIIEHAMKNK